MASILYGKVKVSDFVAARKRLFDAAKANDKAAVKILTEGYRIVRWEVAGRKII